jgi:hypothetical protein
VAHKSGEASVGYGTNALELHFRQEVVHGNLQGLDSDRGDIHTPYSNIEEDMDICQLNVLGDSLFIINQANKEQPRAEPPPVLAGH